MKNRIGRPRKLTDSQVKIILTWHARYLAWRALGRTLKSQRALARELGVRRPPSATSFVGEGSTNRCARRAAGSDQGTREQACSGAREVL